MFRFRTHHKNTFLFVYPYNVFRSRTGGDHKKSYLMADLQEPCFEGRHATYVAMLTMPQLLLTVIGLPLVATLVVVRNKAK
jgi:hypothetical protein